MDSNIRFEGEFSPSVKTWIEDEIGRAFTRCAEQFDAVSVEWKMPSIVVKEGDGGEARFHQLELHLSSTLNLNPQHSDEEGIYELKKAKRLIHHELVHVFQHQVLGEEKMYSLPTWFSEGMAVAFSQQTLSWNADQLQKDLNAMARLPGAERYLLMTRYIPFNMRLPPFDALYEIWGGLFAHAVAENAKLHPGYQIDNGPHLLADEYRRAVAVVHDTKQYGFDKALSLHTKQQVLTPANFRNELLAFISI